jgi:hypothetical protein
MQKGADVAQVDIGIIKLATLLSILSSILDKTKIFFSFPQTLHRLWSPSSFLPAGYSVAISPGIKRPWRESGQSPSASAKVENKCKSRPKPAYLRRETQE